MSDVFYIIESFYFFLDKSLSLSSSVVFCLRPGLEIL